MQFSTLEGHICSIPVHHRSLENLNIFPLKFPVKKYIDEDPWEYLRGAEEGYK